MKYLDWIDLRIEAEPTACFDMNQTAQLSGEIMKNNKILYVLFSNLN